MHYHKLLCANRTELIWGWFDSGQPLNYPSIASCDASHPCQSHPFLSLPATPATGHFGNLFATTTNSNVPLLHLGERNSFTFPIYKLEEKNSFPFVIKWHQNDFLVPNTSIFVMFLNKVVGYIMLQMEQHIYFNFFL